MLGGSGSDLFIWDPGDGSDLLEGEDGIDVFLFNGTAAAYRDVHPQCRRRAPRVLANVGGIDMDVAGVEQVDLHAVNGAAGSDEQVIINDISQPKCGSSTLISA